MSAQQTMSASARSWWATTADSTRRLLFGAFILAVSAAATLSPGPAAAQSGQRQFSPDEVAAVSRVEEYLNSIGTLRAEFVQIDPTGELAEGTLYLDRPGKMRFDYDPPSPLLLIADGFWFIYIDREMEEATHFPINATPANFLLREELRFGEDYAVTDIVIDGGLVELDIVDRGNPDAGSVRLVFDQNPMRLRQWTVTDSQDLKTRVTLISQTAGLDLDSSLFFYRPANGQPE